MTSLDSETLRLACASARTKWLRQLLAEHLPRLVPLSDSQNDLEIALEWDSMLKEQFATRGLISLHQQKNLITDVRNAIKVIDPKHPVLSVVGFTANEWIEINSTASTATASRTTQFLASPDAITSMALELLQSRQWSEVAAGLAVVTGRRVSEILKTAEFTLKSTYSVIFTGAVKRRHESVTLTFEIPTLVEAKTVIEAIAKLRHWLDTSHLNNRQINDKYEQAVAQVCDRHFRDLVPLREGKGNLYTHLFRAVYATIATHWFCPPTVSDLEFRAYIQGHFKILHEANSEKRTSMAAQRHYWDYKIADGQGNVDGRLGIKLQSHGVQVLEAFNTSQTKTMNQSHGSLVHLRVFSDDRTALARIQEQFDLPSRGAANHFVLELAQSLLTTAETLNLTPQQLTAKLTAQDFESSLQTSDSSDQTAEQDFDHLSTNKQPIAEPPPKTATTEDESDPSDLVDTNSVDLNQSQALFERMDRQQQSLSSLTDAIQGLVEVLAHSHSPSSPASTSTSKSHTKPSDTIATSRISDKSAQTSDTISPRQRRSQISRQKVNRYIDAIMAYNDVLNRPHSDKWLITIAALKRLTHCGQSVIYDVLNSRATDIQFHHDQHQLGPYHNQKGSKVPKIESVISLG